MSDSIGSSRNRAILGACLALVALAARLFMLSSKSLWADEAYAAGLVELPLIEAMRLFSAGTPHPGGGLAVIWLSTRLFGAGEPGLRGLVSIISASASIPLFCFLGRRTGLRGAAWATACWAFCPWSVSLGQEAWVYGMMAALTIWAVYLADLAWRGSWKALAGFTAVSIAGVWVQLMFLISVAASVGLFFTIPRTGRVRLLRPALSVIIVILSACPLLLSLPAEFAERSSRMARAGIGGLDFGRLASRSPSVLVRFLSGGLLPDSFREMAGVPRYLAVFAAGTAVQLFALASTFLGRRASLSNLAWMAALLLLPLLIFLSDDPTARQFPLGWLATAATIAFASARHRWFGPLAVSVCLLLLAGYYRIGSFPYHRSDWRSATAQVEAASRPGDMVVLTGARSMTQAWGFYAVSGLETIDTSGGNPYLSDAASPELLDPVAVVDSLTSAGLRTWVVMDHWWGPSLGELFPDGTLLPPVPGSVMQVMLLERMPKSPD